MSPEDPPPGDAAEKRPDNRRTIFLFAPLLISVLAVAGWLIWRDEALLDPDAASATPTVEPAAAGSTPAPDAVEPATDVPGDGFGIVSGLATPWAVAGGPGAATAEAAVATALPTATGAPVTLLGPPPGSAFMAGDVVTFYWSAPLTPAVGQQFVVYLDGGNEANILGHVAAANLGQGYQLQATPGAAVGQPGSYSWYVVLAGDTGEVIIAQSESRPLTILADN